MARELRIRFKQVAGPTQESIKKHRLAQWTKQVLEAPPHARAHPTLVQHAEDAFSELSKQQLIAKLVAML